MPSRAFPFGEGSFARPYNTALEPAAFSSRAFVGATGRRGSARTLGGQHRSQTVKTFVARTADQWRKWLGEHHDSESEVWLVFHKLHTGVGSIAYLDALDEALCFGWVDSLVKRLDESRYARKFTPRNADSRWSTINRKRYAALKAAGRLKPSGINRAPTDRSYGPRPPRFQMPATVPRYIQAALIPETT